ncbi:CBS domain-containing protein [Roseomonas sp. GC11]|uniref:CBS domain-containing protein n=1 Tax=Roseomonas sp. GC11 TaxID=2950546 RepID=UPI00210CC77B|nr:CBS domain-containing protein [Roseomonas sp. GC11]MCQ4161426.1 CBS domain-containing protein [Roseomonas sp. GC11]
MSPLTAKDLMTPDVVTVPPETPVLAIAQLLADRGISAVPVLSGDGAVLGIVTEADLIRRLAGQGDHQMGLLRQLFADLDRMAERYASTHGATAADVMTVDVITVTPSTPVSAIAELMEEKHIRRVLVVDQGRLRGVVSRADLLRALVAPQPEGGDYSDDRLRRAVLAAIKREPWAETFFTLVDVKDGIVELHGFSRSPAVQRGLKVLAEQIPGVKGVVDKTQPLPTYLFAAA